MLNIYPLVRPILFQLPAETAHNLVVGSLSFASKLGIYSRRQRSIDPILKTRLWGRDFCNPIGLSAGLDKNASAIDALLALGFGFVEVGAVTRKPQKGNQSPRLFRLKDDEGIINRFGFPNRGLHIILGRLKRRHSRKSKVPGIVGCNIGVNESINTSVDATVDYAFCVENLTNFVDYIVINCSCPNTPGLRELQNREPLEKIVLGALAARDAVSSENPPPLLLKIDPDINDSQKAAIVEIATSTPIDGLIVSNTTTQRPTNLRSKNSEEKGGLSGAPLFEISTKFLREIYRLTSGKIPIIGVGGIRNGRDAYAKIRSGASLVQIYTALVYRGPDIVDSIKRELSQLLRDDGFESVQDAVGVDVQLIPRQKSSKPTVVNRPDSRMYKRDRSIEILAS